MNSKQSQHESCEINPAVWHARSLDVAHDSPLKTESPIDAHVVIINNYLRPHHVAAYRALAQNVRRLTILLSVSMEPDREWAAQWSDLDVRLQKNWMFVSNWKHSSGFKEPNFIHLPLDTVAQLKQLSPDIVFSYEMGFRTLLASRYRRAAPDSRLVMVGNMSDHIEKERGLFRRGIRRLIRRRVDAFSFNGPSCRRYLKRLNIPDEKLFHLPYCIDPKIVVENKTTFSTDGIRRLLYCGAISERKGVLKFVHALNRWCESNPDRQIEFSIAGDGPQASQINEFNGPNLKINFLGNCHVETLKEHYQKTDICVFPSLADEWGLVPIEAMASGVPVLGSFLAQSIETCVQENVTGWTFVPTATATILDAIGRALDCSPEKLSAMGRQAKQSVAHISAQQSADCFSKIVAHFVTPQSKF